MLIDSNVIIYAAQPKNKPLRDFIAANAPPVSAVSYVEVLGYHRHTKLERQYYDDFFEAATILPLSPSVISQAVKLRQLRKMTLGDSLIAATALVNNLPLVTHNKKDFEWIPNLTVLDPFTELPLTKLND